MTNRPAVPDVVVIGAGVFGLASAWELARNGHSVVVLDRAPVGTEASGWALGRIDPLLKGSGSTGTIERDLPAGHLAKPDSQQEITLLAYRLHQELTPEIERISGIDLLVDLQPTLQLFYSKADQDFGAQYAARWTDSGFKTALVSADEIFGIDARLRPTEFGGAIVHGPYFIDSLRFVRALAACARSAGVRLETATVTSIENSPNDSVTVHTDQGHYEAGCVAVAAGPWTPQLLAPLEATVPVHPSKGEILRLRPPDDVSLPMHILGPCSVVKKRDGLVWVAATTAEVGFDKTPTDAARQKLLGYAGSMMPDSAAWPVVKHSACLRPATPDDQPIVGAVSGNVVVASGGGGGGIVQCLLVGREIANLVTNGEPEISAISIKRFSGQVN